MKFFIAAVAALAVGGCANMGDTGSTGSMTSAGYQSGPYATRASAPHIPDPAQERVFRSMNPVN